YTAKFSSSLHAGGVIASRFGDIRIIAKASIASGYNPLFRRYWSDPRRHSADRRLPVTDRSVPIRARGAATGERLTDITTLWAAFGTAELWQIIALSLVVSVSATAVAAALGLPFGAGLAIWRFPGRYILIVTANALLGLPPVVVGLALYLLLS